jgi:hypothetical protein
MVAINSTFLFFEPEISRPPTIRGWANTAPSTLYRKSLPNLPRFSASGLNVLSHKLAPVR